MTSKKLTRVWRVLIVLFTAWVAILLSARDHFIFGTVLVMFRWVLLALGAGFLYVTARRVTPVYLRAALAIVLAGILFEYCLNKINEANLKEGESSFELSLMTYNVFFKNAKPDSSIRKIKQYNPDILLVQELTPLWKQRLASAIGRSYPFSSVIARRGTHGMGVYSKYPIVNTRLLGTDDRPYAQVVTLIINARRVRLFNVHLASPAIAVEHPERFIELYSSNSNVRRKQLESVTSLANQDEQNFDVQLLAGDLNTTVYEPIYRDLSKHWVNLHDIAGSGFGFTFPNSTKVGPLTTLDYIMIRGTTEGISSKVIKGGSSDHLAVAGKIKI